MGPSENSEPVSSRTTEAFELCSRGALRYRTEISPSSSPVSYTNPNDLGNRSRAKAGSDRTSWLASHLTGGLPIPKKQNARAPDNRSWHP